MKMKPQSAKAKGRALQKWACIKIAELVGLEWGREKPIESRPMGQRGVDVRLDDEAIARFPFSVECKFQERWSIPEWIDQAKVNKKDGTNWLLICKQSRKPPVVVMDAEAFFEMLKWNRNGQGSVSSRPENEELGGSR